MKELDELISAIETGDLSKVQKLLPARSFISWTMGSKKEPAPLFLNMRDSKGNTALVYAIKKAETEIYSDPEKKIIGSSNDQQIIKWLIDSGADINLTDSSGCSPFAAALEKDPIFALYEFYLKDGFKICVADKLSLLYSHRADNFIPLLKTKDEIVDFINSLENPNIEDYNGNNLFHAYFANYNFREQCPLEFLISKNIDINHPNKDQETPFISAIKRYDLNSAEQIKQIPGFILTKEAKKILNEKMYEHAYHWNLDNILLKRIKKYLSLGADINSLAGPSSEQETILHRCINKMYFSEFADNSDNFDIIRFFIENGANPKLLDASGKSILTKLIEEMDFAKLKFVKESIEKITNDEMKFSPEEQEILNQKLHKLIDSLSSSESSKIEFIRLIEIGADPNYIDAEGQTLLHKLIEKSKTSDFDFIDIFKELVERGADVNIKDSKDRYPLDIALETYDLKLIKELYSFPNIKGDIEKAEEMLGISIAGQLRETEKNRFPYFKKLDKEITLEDLNNARLLKLYKEIKLKSLYFRTNKLELNEELAKFIKETTQNGLREMVIFCNKEESSLSKEQFNEFLQSNKVRINLKIIPVTNEDLDVIAKDSFGKRDILAIKKFDNYKFIYRNGHSVELLNSKQSDEIIIHNYNQYKHEIASRHHDGEYKPKYILNEKEGDFEPIEKSPLSLEISVDRERETSIDFNLQIDTEKSQQIALDQNQVGTKFDRYNGRYKIIEIYRKSFLESYLLDRNYHEHEYMLYNLYDAIFDSDINIKYITEQALGIIVDNRFLLYEGINTNNMPIGLALTDGIIFASNKRPDSMPINEFTIRLDPLVSTIENPLQYSWIGYSALDSITANDLYGTDIAPFLRGSAEYPDSEIRNQKLCFPYYTKMAGYNVNEIRQEPRYLNAVHPELISIENKFNYQKYRDIHYYNLTESDKKRIDHIYGEFSKRGFSTELLNKIIYSHSKYDYGDFLFADKASVFGDFLLSDKATLFLDKLFYEILPLNDPDKIEFFNKILITSSFKRSYLEDVFNGIDGLYKKTNEFLIKQEIPTSHHELVKSKIIEIAKQKDKTALATQMDRFIGVLSATAENGGNIFEQLDYIRDSNPLQNIAIVSVIKDNNLNVVYTSKIEIADQNTMLENRNFELSVSYFNSYLSKIPPHQRPAIDTMNHYIGYSRNLEYKQGNTIVYAADSIIEDSQNEVLKKLGHLNDYAVRNKINQKIKEFYDQNDDAKRYKFVQGIKTNDADLIASFTEEQVYTNNLLLTLNILSSSGKNYDATYPDGEFSKYISLFNVMFQEVKPKQEIPYSRIEKCRRVQWDHNKEIYLIKDYRYNAPKSNSVIELELKHKQMVNNLVDLYKEQPNLNFHQIVALGLVKNFVPDNQNVIKNAKSLYQYKEYFTQSLRTILATKITEHTDITELRARANNIARLVNFLASGEKNKPIHQLLTNNGNNPENIALFACFFSKEEELTHDKIVEFLADVNEIRSDLKMNLLKRFALNELPFANGAIGNSNFPELKLADIKNHALLTEISSDQKSLVNYEHARRFNDIGLDSKEQAKIDFTILQKKYGDEVQLPNASYREIKYSILRDTNYIKENIANYNPDQSFLQELAKEIVHEMLKTTSEQYLGWQSIVSLTTDLLFDSEKTLNSQLLEIEANNRHLRSLFKNIKGIDNQQEFLNSLLAEPKIAKNKLGKILKFLRSIDYQTLAAKNYDLNKLVKETGNDILSNHLDSFKIATQLFIEPENKLEFSELTNIIKLLVEKNYSPLQIKKIFSYCTLNNDYQAIKIFSSINGRTNNIDKIINKIIQLKPEEIALIEQKIGLNKLVKLSPILKIQETIETVLKYKDELTPKEYSEIYNHIKGRRKLDYSKNLFGYLLSPDSDYLPREGKLQLILKNLNDLEPLKEIFAKRNLKRFDYDTKRLEEIVGKIRNLNDPNDQPLPTNQQEIILKSLERIYIEAKKYSKFDETELLAESRNLQNNRLFIVDNPPEEGSVLENDLKFIALSAEMAYRKMKFFPRDTQLLSIVMTALLDGHQNQKISTGQGKTLITAMQSAYLAYTGQTTIVTSSNRQLAARDLNTAKRFFDGLGLDTASNIITINTDPSELSSGKIVYSTASDIALFLAQKKFDKAPGYLELLARLSRVGDEIDDALTSPITYKLAVPMSDITQNQARILFQFILDYTESDIFKDHQLSIKSHVHNFKEMIQVKFSQFDNSYRYPLSIVQAANLAKKTEPEARYILDFNNSLLEIEKGDLDIVIKKLLLSAQTAKELRKDIDYMVPNDDMSNSLISAVPIVADRVAKGTRFGDGIQTFLHLLIERDNPSLKGKMDCSLPNSVMFDLNAKNLHNYISLTGGRNIGLTGTPGGPGQLEEFHSVLGINSISIPDYESSRKIVIHTEVKNSKEQDQALLKEIEQLDKEEPARPIVIFCEDAVEVARINELLKGKRKHIQLADANTDNNELDKIVDNAGKDGYLTITTPILGRGNDFITNYPNGYIGFNLCTKLTSNTLEQIEGRIGRNGYQGTIKSFFNKENYPNFENHKDFMEHIAQVDTDKRASVRPAADIMLHFNTANAGNQLEAVRTIDFITNKWKELNKINNKLTKNERQTNEELQKHLLESVIKKYPEEKLQLLQFLAKIDEHKSDREGKPKLMFNAESVEQDLNPSQIIIDARNFPTNWQKIDQLARSISLNQVATPKESDPLSYKLFFDVFYETQATVLYTHFFEIDKKHQKYKIFLDYDGTDLDKDKNFELTREFEIEGEGSNGNLMMNELKHSFDIYLKAKPSGKRINNIAKIIQNMDNINNIDIKKLSPGKYQAFSFSTEVTTQAGHIESILTDGKFLFWINRGGGVENPGIRIFKVSKDFASVKDVLNSLKLSKNQVETNEKVYSLLERNDNSKIPQFTQVDMPAQTIGNCGWVQVESLVKAIGLAGSLDSNSKELPKIDSSELQISIKNADDIYQDFLKFDRLQRIEEVLYTRDKDFTPKYLSKNVISEIDTRRPYLINPISIELLKPLTKAFEKNIGMFENSIYENDAVNLLHRANVETILSDEFGKLFTQDREQIKKLLIDLSTPEIIALNDLYNSHVKHFCDELETQTKILLELTKYITSNTLDGEDVIQELKRNLYPVKVSGNKNTAIDQAILYAVQHDDLASTTILINALGIHNISDENLETIAEYALNNHNNEILSLIRPRVEEIILQQNDANPSEIERSTKKYSILRQIDEKFKFPEASAAKISSVFQAAIKNLKKADEVLAKTENSQQPKSQLHWQALSSTDRETLKSLEAKYNVKLDSSKAINKLALKLHPDKVAKSNEQAISDFIKLGELKDKLKKGVFVEQFSEEDSAALKKAQEQIEQNTYLYKWQEGISKANFAINLTNAGVNAYRFIVEPTYKHGKQLLTDTAQLASMTYGLSWLPMTLTAADVIDKTYHQEYSSAFQTAATSLAFQTMPIIASKMAGPAGGVAFSALMTGYSAMHLFRNASKLYEENVKITQTESSFAPLSTTQSKVTEIKPLKNEAGLLNKLQQAIIDNNIEKFISLAKDAKNLNEVNEHGISLINFAIIRKKKEFVKALVDIGASVNEINQKNKFSSLKYAASLKDNNEIVEILLKAGAQPTIDEIKQYPQYFLDKGILKDINRPIKADRDKLSTTHSKSFASEYRQKSGSDSFLTRYKSSKNETLGKG